MLTLEQAARGFSAVGSGPRLNVMLVLVRAGQDGLTVSDIQKRAGLPASTLAHHLRYLADGGLIEQEKRGRAVYNRAVFTRLEALGAYLLQECCAEALPDAPIPAPGH